MLCVPWRRRRRITEQWQASSRFNTKRRKSTVVDDGPSQSEVFEQPVSPANHISLQMAEDVADGLHNIPPIFSAIQSNDTETVKTLLQENPTLLTSARCGGLAPLHAVCHIQNLNILVLLLEHGADALSLDDHGNTALHLAVKREWHKGIEELLRHGASTDTECEPPPHEQTTRETPFHTAVRLGDVETVKLMLTYKPNLTALDGKGCCVLHMAARVHSVQIINILLQDKVVQEVLHTRDCDGNTVLHTALIEDHGSVEEAILLEIVRLFFEAGVDVNTTNSYGESALYLAARFGLPNLVELLLSMGADPLRVTTKGASVLHAACHRGCATSLDLLLKTGQMKDLITKEDKSGREPFHCAVYSSSIDCCELLIRNGDHLTRKDCDGVTRSSLIIDNLPSAKELLSRLFDSCVRIPNKFRRDPDFHISFDYSVLLPVDQDIQSSLIPEINVGEAESLLKHPLIESFLYKKWNKIKFFFYGNVLTFFIFLTMHTAYIDSIFQSDARPDNLVRGRAFRVSYICIYLLVLVPEILNMCAHPKKFFKSWESLTKFTSLSTSAIIVFSYLDDAAEIQDQILSHGSTFTNLAAVSIFSSWVELMMLLGRFPALGTYILMFSRIAKSLIYFIMAFSSLLIGFSLAFRVFFYKSENFHGFIPSMVRTLMMMIGEIDYGSLVEVSGDDTPILCYIFLALFLFLVCVLMANLLIGLAVDDIAKLQTLGRIARLSKQASYIITYERLTRFAIKTKLFPFHSAEKLDKICRLKPRCNIYLNRKRSRMFHRKPLPYEAVEAAVIIGHAEAAPTESDSAAKAVQALEKANVANITAKLEDIEKMLQRIVPEKSE
ncbi:transient receptor potential channel pyrexia-like [Penaeus monodon]|uniref:transient receptor potential channel pyrexia-like n=1 Tax=Penaeus monodon TaxID=6687 RepID=UPI0018A70790|nr:transient receptor potential channel pyrexia-like [Penaeus monodon]XP_037791466.1 transient receptor potential channel pyrexia-like [Penaeus monodon]